ncbi:DUF3422 family protein [Azospirillum picis]|uniref:Membrane-anchored protein n=1 Tax=Azospirillum picis TaxID=488438 RepID=A0ABU0MTS2_9PROT|nr:DUF3422 domain-containing protein [Azospirillum picis]MBP2303137.1 putative membrane-anchored protein [Azospirillum picis]MDQ0536889.1 putative membrane-anchored protein [Azospirillum picis]
MTEGAVRLSTDALTRDGAGGPRPLRDHPLRQALTNEVHARPPESLATPMRATMLAMLSGEAAGEADRRHLEALCDWAGVARPPQGATHHSADFGSFHLKWERHTEFSTWTVFRPSALPAGRLADPFLEPALQALPREWLAGLPGELLVGIHVAVLDPGTPEPSANMMAAMFGSESYVGSRVAGRAATTWTDFRIHGDGFSRMLVADHSMTPRQTGRIVQRLLEIETYRVLALLALPMARGVLPRIGPIEAGLAEVAARVATLQGLQDERDLLDRLTRLAAQTEQIAAETAYRFGAARAYHDLVLRRIEELREIRIEGLQTIAEFMDRRLTPAIRTCEAVEGRLSSLSQRVARTSDLLRTRVEIAVEGQNAELLQSMDRRAHLQLRLQETVEGLSVVAISYYLVGIVGYAAKGMKGFGFKVDPDMLVGLMIPVVIAFVWSGVRRIRKVLVGGH